MDLFYYQKNNDAVEEMIATLHRQSILSRHEQSILEVNGKGANISTSSLSDKLWRREETCSISLCASSAIVLKLF